MDLKADLAGKLYYGGRANVDEDGNFYLMDLDGYLWTNNSPGTEGYLWTNGYLWTDGYLWTNAYLWTNGEVGANGYLWTNGHLWTNGYLWSNGYLWTNFEGQNAGINVWVQPD